MKTFASQIGCIGMGKDENISTQRNKDTLDITKTSIIN